MMKNGITCIFCFFLFYQVQAQVVINEICTRNGNGLADFQDQTEDWVELYNAGSSPVSLEEYGLSDEEDEPRFVFPDITLNPGDFLLVFLSGKNLVSPEYHTSFKLKQGEKLYLFDDDEEVIDEISADGLQLDHSKGRFPNGAPAFYYFDDPSPDSTNNVSATYAAYVTDPVFNHPGGFYHGHLNLQISCATPGATIHYTTNGDIPTPLSPVWTGTQTYHHGKVIRAMAFKPGLLPSNSITQSFFLNEHHRLPVVHIITDSVHLFDTITGLFERGPLASPLPPYHGANFWNDTEHPAVIQFFEDEALVFSQEVGMAIHGGSINRSQDMKSLRISARKKYGNNSMDYAFFPSRDLISYKKLVLRNGSSDFCHAQMRDELVSDNLLGTTYNDVLANRPCVTYINGQYWGIYHLREKRGRHNLSALHGVNADSLDILRDNLTEAWKGDTIAFRQLYSFAMNHDFSQEEHFNAFAERMDMENFADYFISEIFYGNFDWPFNNIEVWRERKAGSKFRYQLFDFDVAFMGTPWAEYHYNLWDKIQSSYCDTSYHINLLEKSLTNRKYYEYFVNRYCDLLNTIFTPAHLQERTDVHRYYLNSEIPRHFDRWGAPVGQWASELNKVAITNLYRPQIQLEQLRDALLPGNIAHLHLGVHPADAGHIHLNTLLLHESAWEGNYFDGVPVQLEARSKPGYTFRAWKVEQEGATQYYTQPELSLTPVDGMRITAIYTDGDESVLEVFPNPASTMLTIRVLELTNEPTRAEVVDLTGRVVYTTPLDHNQTMNDVTVDVSHYPPGVYLARIVSENRVLSVKFMRE